MFDVTLVVTLAAREEERVQVLLVSMATRWRYIKALYVCDNASESPSASDSLVVS